MSEQTSLFDVTILTSFLSNLINAIYVLLSQFDGLLWNALLGFGIYYIFSIVFIVIGLKKGFNAKDNIIFSIWFVSSTLLMLVFKNANISFIYQIRK